MIYKNDKISNEMKILGKNLLRIIIIKENDVNYLLTTRNMIYVNILNMINMILIKMMI